MEGRRSLLRDHDFGRLVASVGLSAMGDWVAIVALGLQVQERTESGLAVALLWICLFGPSVAVAGHAGLLVDRFETSRLLAAIATAGVAVSLALAQPIALILALTALLGVVFAIAQPAEFALVPRLAGDRVQEANGQVETSRYLGFAAGPLLGGALVSASGPELAMLVNAGSFAAVALAALSLRVRRPPVSGEPGHEQPRAHDGVQVLFRDRLLALVMVVAFASLLFMSAVWVAELFFIRETLDMGGTAYGLFATTWTLGMMAGALVLSRRVVAAAIASTGLAAVAVQGASLAVPTLWLSYGFLLACSAIGGLAHGVKNVMFRTLIHVRVPERLHGRAFAAYNGIRNGAELGAFAAGGFLVTAIGARGTMSFAGGLSALAGLLGLIWLLRMNRGWRPAGPASPSIEVPATSPAAPDVATLASEPERS